MTRGIGSRLMTDGKTTDLNITAKRASWRVWLRLVAGRNQLKPAFGTGRARLCAYVKRSTLNSAIDPELRDRKVEDRANATSSA